MNKEVILVKIGLKIREFRKEKNLSIMEFSDKLEIEYNNLIRIEKGRTNFTIGTLLKICKALDVKLVDIVNVE
ncbi:MAG: helix-turn-helix transcriptional regulator [Prevotellaceae bacterium]|jgi:transcriptional regulator with XRE-family HTH domain|nr:helix-turn-helix transcriptional regulator [Prevotellaceae bacterium]